MGEAISTTMSLNNDQMDGYLQKLQFVQNIKDPNFGPIEVFRLKQPPYEYIMDYKKTFIEGDNRYIKFIHCMNQLAKA